MGDPDFHEIEDQLFDAIDGSGSRAVIKNGTIDLLDPNGLPGENVLVDPAGPEDLADLTVLNLDEAANFARIPRLAGYGSSGPGQGIQLLLCYHDLAQLEAAYGLEEARTIWNNCRARLLLPRIPLSRRTRRLAKFWPRQVPIRAPGGLADSADEGDMKLTTVVAAVYDRRRRS